MSDAEQSSAPVGPADTARAGDADRERAAERLRVAAGEGRIDLAELDERLDQVYSARTYGELRVLMADLPDQPVSLRAHDALPEPETLVLKTTSANLKQSGRWSVPRRITADTTAAFITIDFTQASCAHAEVDLEATAKTGWIRVIIPEGWAARVGPSSTNTSHIKNKAPETA